MLKIYNIKDKREYLNEVATLTQKEWGEACNLKSEFDKRVNTKIDKIIKNLDNKYYCKLILLDKDKLVRFYFYISYRWRRKM